MSDPRTATRRGRRPLATLALAGALVAVAAPALAQAGELESLFVTPAVPTVADSVTLHALAACSDPFSGPPTIEGHTITLETGPFALYPPCAYGIPPYEVQFPLGRLAAGEYTVQVIGNGGVPPGTVVFSFSFGVAAQPATSLTLAKGAFRVEVLHGAVLDHGVVSGGRPAPAVQVADESGYFWFFDSSNMEITVKLLDGGPVNGHLWLFAASMTTEPYVIELIDLRNGCTGPSCVKAYAGVGGENRNVIDLEAASD